MQARKSKELNHAGNVAVVELAKWELSKFKHQVDKFSDTEYWAHEESGMIMMQEPKLQQMLPEGFILPVPRLTPRTEDPLCFDHRHKVVVEKAPDHVVTSLMLSSDKAKPSNSTALAKFIKKGASAGRAFGR
jgi:hypothetical protein